MTKFSELALLNQIAYGSTLFSSQPVEKTVTFAGGVGSGTPGAIDLFRVNGEALLRIFAVTGSTPASAGTPTLSVGLASGTTALMSSGSAKLFTPGLIYHTTGIGGIANSSGSISEFIVSSGTIILTVGLAKITGGNAKFLLSYVPLSDGSTVVAL